MRFQGPHVVTVVLLFAGLGCAQETIAHQQEEREANRILVLLREAGVSAQKVRDPEAREMRFNVSVSEGDTAGALALLEKHNLPVSKRPDTADMFQGGGLIPTSEQERAKRVVGVEGDLVNALRQLPGVVEVEAAVSIPAENPLRDVNEARPKPKASILVVYQPDANRQPPLTTEAFQQFVQAKLPDLRTAEVTVLLVPTGSRRSQQAGVDGDPGALAAGGLPIDPELGCAEKESIFGVEVCRGNRVKLLNLMLGAGAVAAITALLAVIASLKAMRYRKDLTLLTAQFERHR